MGNDGSTCITAQNQIKSNQIKPNQTTHANRADIFTSGTLPADAARKFDVLGKDGHALGMDGNEIGVLKEIDEVALGRLLQGEDSRGLETKIRIEVLGDLTDKAIERSPGGSNKLKDSICKIITCKN